MTFAPEKTQAMVISRSPATKLAAEGKLCFNGVPLPLQETVKILGMEMVQELRFDGHIKHIAQKASHRITVLRRVASFLDKVGQVWCPLVNVVCILVHQETGQHPASSLTTGGC